MREPLMLILRGEQGVRMGLNPVCLDRQISTFSSDLDGRVFLCPPPRMLKKSASGVLASLRPSTLRRGYSEVRNTVGAFPFANIHCMGKRPTRSAVCTSSALRSLRPCLGQGASWRARVGWVRRTAFLSILLNVKRWDVVW